MIAYVEGKIAEITDSSCIVVTASGVGYEVFVPQPLLFANSNKGQDAHFFISTVVREDAFELFGFASWDERETFVLLRSINRVGARTALGILSVFSPDDLRRICLEDNPLALTKVSGIGKKTAQQIFLELKYKLSTEGTGTVLSSASMGGGSVQLDAVAGLLNLGYAEHESQQVVKKIVQESAGADVGEVLRKALKILANN